MMSTLSRSEAVDYLSRKVFEMLSLEDRESILLNCWWQEPESDDPAVGDPACDANQPPRIVYEEDGYPHIVGPELPNDPEKQLYNAVLLAVLRHSYAGVTDEYLARQFAAWGWAGVVVTDEVELFLACACVEQRTLDLLGEYDICPVCFWEDDGNRDPERYSSVNHMTLGEARRNFRQFGASGQEYLESVDSTPGKYLRDAGFPID